MRRCDRCGKEYEPKKVFLNKPKYCSAKCRLDAWAIKRANELKSSSSKIFPLVVVMILLTSSAFASTPEYFNKVVDAIYKAEGGPKAKVPYGILSVKVSSKEEARKVCYNTVRNNWKRWEVAGKPGTYLSFLANRYCPVGAENDPKGLNKNWCSNVERLMR